MVSKIRVTLAILLIGFIIEGALEAYTYVNHSYPLPYASSVLVFGPLISLVGILTLWIGRRDWDQPLRLLFRLAQRAFGFNILALLLAIVPVVWYGSRSAQPIPSWVAWEFGAAIVAALLFNFVIYVLVAFELTAHSGKTLLFVAFGWACIVSFWIGSILAGKFGAIVLIVQNRTLDIAPVAASISGVESYLAATYFLLTIVYFDAFRRSRVKTAKSASTRAMQPSR